MTKKKDSNVVHIDGNKQKLLDGLETFQARVTSGDITDFAVIGISKTGSIFSVVGIEEGILALMGASSYLHSALQDTYAMGLEYVHAEDDEAEFFWDEEDEEDDD